MIYSIDGRTITFASEEMAQEAIKILSLTGQNTSAYHPFENVLKIIDMFNQGILIASRQLGNAHCHHATLEALHAPQPQPQPVVTHGSYRQFEKVNKRSNFKPAKKDRK